MVVLHHRRIVVSYRNLVSFLDEEQVIKAAMVQVMTGSSQNICQHINLIEGTFLSELACGTEVIKGLRQITGMGLIVISNILIWALQFLHEWQEFFVVKGKKVEELFLGQNVPNHSHHFIILSQFSEREYVERVIFNLLQLYFGFLTKLQNFRDDLTIDFAVYLDFVDHFRGELHSELLQHRRGQ